MKQLIVFTKNFGENFTGATISTVNLIKEFKNTYKPVIVLCFNEGKHHFLDDENIIIIKLKSFMHLFRVLKEYQNKNTVFYSDDHFGWILRLRGKKYFHTYHGNWPDAMFVSFKMFLKSFFFIPNYFLTIFFAKAVIHVSYYMNALTRVVNGNSCVIRNGLGTKGNFTESNERITSNDTLTFKIIMVGNIDSRKYKKAVQIFNTLKKSEIVKDIKVDIYGKILNKKIKNRLEKNSFVEIKGFVRNINFKNYNCFLTTSKSENLPISICESIYNGLPVIAPNTGGINEVVNLENGALFNFKDDKAVTQILSLTKSGKLNFNVKQESIRDFNWSYAAKSYIKIFELND